ncbi:uncharacterized protein P884DRAFT_280823 [Thermothelomyces heterothallicus CBS 202.75]|uniref:uncharacterized protein n=1 Tax=Thermothelomyces heterothallicus CBS 202.75 TaxID=1149848 RepID=UPI0037445813
MLSQFVMLLGLASATLGQVTLQPSTVRTGRPGLPTVTVTATVTKTESYIHEQTKTITTTETETETETETLTETITSVSVTTQPCSTVSCPTLTRTATACRSCLVPQCTTTSVVTRPNECAATALPTATVSFPCSDPDVCGKIGCTTVYDIRSAA